MADQTPIMSYEDLLEQIRSIQSVLDEQNPLQTTRTLPSLIHDMWIVDYYLNHVQDPEYWTQTRVIFARRVMRARTYLVNQITTISHQFNLDGSLVQHLPPLWSQNWYNLYHFVRLMTESSQVVPQTVNSSQEEHVECPICIESIKVGERYIQFPCWPEHRIHEACFTEYAGYTPHFSCPLCRQFPIPQ